MTNTVHLKLVNADQLFYQFAGYTLNKTTFTTVDLDTVDEATLGNLETAVEATIVVDQSLSQSALISAIKTSALGVTIPPAVDTSGFVTKVAAPSTATSTGVAGTIAYDATHIYVCVATNTWVRATLATW